MINVKNSQLAYFEIFKKRKPAKNYLQDCNDFELKEKIREDLLQKQRNQCAYCERKIEKTNSHIEHIRQRDKFHQLECEYSNLVLSCNDGNSCGKYKDSQKNPIAKYTSSVVEFELFCGALDKEKHQSVEKVLSTFTILPFSSEISQEAANIYKYLKQNNLLIEMRDIFIAATAVIKNRLFNTLLSKGKRGFIQGF
jgi:uncharacterized protein (TIGR02646 family)